MCKHCQCYQSSRFPSPVISLGITQGQPNSVTLICQEQLAEKQVIAHSGFLFFFFFSLQDQVNLMSLTLIF